MLSLFILAGWSSSVSQHCMNSRICLTYNSMLAPFPLVVFCVASWTLILACSVALYAKVSRGPLCIFLEFFLYIAPSSLVFCHSDFNYSSSMNSDFLLSSARSQCCTWDPPLWTMDFAVDKEHVLTPKARVIAGFPHLCLFSQQSEVLYCLWCNIWKELFQKFCSFF